MKRLQTTTLSDFHVPATGGYDGVGNHLSVTATVNGGAPANYSGTTSYAYDYGQTTNPQLNRSQLTGETSTRANATFSYGYDGSTNGGPGNPTSFEGTTSTFNANNQVTNTGYTYDGAGNPTTYKNTALTFDPENRMTTDGTAETNSYDGDGLRAWQQAGTNTSTRTYFLCDGDQRLLALRSDGSVQYYLTFGANGLVSMHNTAVSTDDRYFTFDLSGATVARLAPNQSVQYTIGGQSSFGWCNPTDTMGGMGAQWGYFCDGATGLILCTHRFYDPSTGRFVTRDPAGYDGGVNLYGYVGNNAVNEADASGYDKDGYPSPGPAPYPTPPAKPGPQPYPLPTPPGGTITVPGGPVTVPVGGGGSGGTVDVPLPPVFGGPGGPPTYTPPPIVIGNPKGPPITIQYPPIPVTGPIKIGPPVITVPIGNPDGPVSGFCKFGDPTGGASGGIYYRF